MSKLNIYSVRDEKAKAYANPFFVPTTGMALRGFEQECLNKDSMLCKYPEDYNLFCLGSWDPSTGKVDHLEVPQHVGAASEYVRKDGSQEDLEAKIRPVQ